jgi:hypothetical protein
MSSAHDLEAAFQGLPRPLAVRRARGTLAALAAPAGGAAG